MACPRLSARILDPAPRPDESGATGVVVPNGTSQSVRGTPPWLPMQHRSPRPPLPTRPARALWFAAIVSIALLAGATAFNLAPVDAASCVRISGGVFDAPGNDGLRANLNGEWVRIKNYCSTTKSLARWRLHDYGKKHTYVFSSTFTLKPGKTVTVYSGRGTNTAMRRYWGRTSGAVWNNSPPEWAYLRTSTGKLMSRWSPFVAAPTPTAKPTPEHTPVPTPLPTPVAFISCSASGRTATCTGAGSTDATTYSWDFGDGTTDVGKIPGLHTYADPGGYTITLTVANVSGSDSATQYLTVGP